MDKCPECGSEGDRLGWKISIHPCKMFPVWFCRSWVCGKVWGFWSFFHHRKDRKWLEDIDQYGVVIKPHEVDEMIRAKQIYSFKPPADYRKKEEEEVRVEYVITKDKKANMGIMIYTQKGACLFKEKGQIVGRLEENWNTDHVNVKPLVRHLLEKLEVIKQRS